MESRATTTNRENIASLILNRQLLTDYMPEGAIPPKLKGKLKDHKDGKPLRGVSDATNAPGHKLAKALNQIFKPYTGQTKTAEESKRDVNNCSYGFVCATFFPLDILAGQRWSFVYEI